MLDADNKGLLYCR